MAVPANYRIISVERATGLAQRVIDEETNMPFTKWGFIYLGTGTDDPERDRAVIEHGGLTTTFVAVPDRSMVPQVAADLVHDGAQAIELCGAFGPVWTANVIEATGGKVPVGSVSYGQESLEGLAVLFSED